jgi:hypothetical protein
MYAVNVGENRIVFAHEISPGFDGEFKAGVTIEADDDETSSWPGRHDSPREVLCVSRDDPNAYRAFGHQRDVDLDKYELTGLSFDGIVACYPGPG